MNKKLLFTVAAIPAAFILPTVVGAEEASTVLVTGTNTVNETLKASVENLPANTIVNKYQWYYEENESGSSTTTKKPISGATMASFTIPAEAAGKTIFVEATSTTGTTFKSESRTIHTLELEITAPTFETTSNFVAPGETVKVTGAKVTDKGGAKLQSSQITYSYQWFYKVGESFTIINGATGGTYKIPADALEKGMKDFIVKVQAKVGPAVVESDVSAPLTVSKEPSDTLINDIKNLRISDNKYNVSTLESFKAEVDLLDKKYQELSAAAKANVTNQDVLKRALADVEAISKLNEKVNKIKEVNEKDLPKYITEIEDAYNKFDLLLRSLDLGDVLYTNIKDILKEPADIAEIAEVRRLNQAIVAILSYENSLVKYVPTSMESLKGTVEAIEADIAKLSKNYQVTVQNQTILNEAKQDIKKIEQFIKLFDKLSVNNTPSKQVTTAKSIRTAYEKLTYKQLQLVPANYVTQLLGAENAEENQIYYLNAEIDRYIGEEIYPINPSAETWQDHVKNVNKIIVDYKSLTKTSTAKIIGYQSILTLQKDLKTAEKIIKDMVAYKNLTLTSGVAESKLQSTYSSTLKAYNKLTSLQQSLVYNADEFLNKSPNVTIDGKEPADKAAAEALKVDIAKFADITKYSFTQLETAVNAATVAYKNLSSSARKYVTNYHLLTAASKDVTGVKSFHKKVQTAREEMDVAKQAKKIETVEKAYAKLPANQQHLAKPQYEDLLNNRLVDGNAPNLSTLNGQIGALVSDDLYTVSLQEIQNLSAQYNKLSSSDKKLITNASILTAAVADVKKVETFMKQYDKSFASNPSTVIKAFAKLTNKQMNLVSQETRQKIIEADKNQQKANETALGLIESINLLVENGDYIADLQAKVTSIRADYDKLSSSEKSIVKNYSKLTQAESDLKKVAEVHALYEAIPAENSETARKAWQTGYGKLSKKLELLYNKLYPNDL
ncbi:hypothetical protein FOH38_00965 [Lysinibacillus fusiformis]|nr:hypothetical protein FOH38_00965 [Lysinibacillus fusiformis]